MGEGQKEARVGVFRYLKKTGIHNQSLGEEPASLADI